MNNNVDDLIESIRSRGYGIELSCWMQGSWVCKIWEGSPVDQSQKMIIVIAGETMLEALQLATNRLDVRELGKAEVKR